MAESVRRGWESRARLAIVLVSLTGVAWLLGPWYRHYQAVTGIERLGGKLTARSRRACGIGESWRH